MTCSSITHWSDFSIGSRYRRMRNDSCSRERLLLRAWRAPAARPTLDIDLLGRMPNEVEAVANVMREVCRQTVVPDGLVFDPDSLHGAPIAEDAVYEGVRVNFQGHLGNARLAMQIDVGFGDVVTPSAGIRRSAGNPGPARAAVARVSA